MQFALLISESPEASAVRKNLDGDRYTGAWWAYYQALAEPGGGAGDLLTRVRT